MHGHKPFGDDGHQEIESLGEEVLLSAQADNTARSGFEEVPSRPARQRLELRNEEAWLKQQLADWDDFDFENLEEL